MTYTCPVCGYPGLEEEPRSSEGGGSYEICPSCGFEFGYDDDARGHSYASYREEWVEKGMKWWASREEQIPPGWNPVEQLKMLDENYMGKQVFVVSPSYYQIVLSQKDELVFPEWDEIASDRGFAASTEGICVSSTWDQNGELEDVEISVYVNDPSLPTSDTSRYLGTTPLHVFSELQLSSPDGIDDVDNPRLQLPHGWYQVSIWGDRAEDTFFRRLTLSFETLTEYQPPLEAVEAEPKRGLFRWLKR